MRPIAPASTTSSPTSTRSASRRTAAAPASAAASSPRSAPPLRGGIEVPGDHQVDNRALLGALVEACRAGGVTFVEGTVAAARRRARARPGGRPPPRPGPRRPGGRDRPRAPSTGWPAPRLPSLRPVKGHILRLGPPGTPARAPSRCWPARCAAWCTGAPCTWCRAATARSSSAPPSRSAAPTPRCRRARCTSCSATPGPIVPGVDELELLEAATGLRPATPDNTPRIGWTALDGVVAATGHYRNGILLAPLTAAAVVDLVGRRPVAPLIEALAPA